MQPDADGIAWLQRAQTLLAQQAGLVAADTLHLTILHIGILHKLFASLRKHSSTSQDNYAADVSQLVGGLESAIQTHGFDGITLEPEAVAHFGSRHDTAVITFKNTPELAALHQASLQALRSYLSQRGIGDVDGFMQMDSNLRHALTLSPHVTLAKSYSGPLPILQLKPARFSIMPIVY